MSMAVELAAETLFRIGPFPFTNTILHTLMVDGLVVWGVTSLKKQVKLIPGTLQNIAEMVFDGLYDLTLSISPKHAKIIFPWFCSLFLFLLVANWSSLLPGFGTIFFKTPEGTVPLLRGAAADLNLTLALAILVTIATHTMAVRTIGIKNHLLRYFSLNPIFMFVGILEIISVFTNIISLSFRLFGNIFAGEVVISTVSKMFAFILPLPFLGLEIIVGMVQALVFATLTMAFMAILTTAHNEGGEH